MNVTRDYRVGRSNPVDSLCSPSALIHDGYLLIVIVRKTIPSLIDP